MLPRPASFSILSSYWCRRRRWQRPLSCFSHSVSLGQPASTGGGSKSWRHELGAGSFAPPLSYVWITQVHVHPFWWASLHTGVLIYACPNFCLKTSLHFLHNSQLWMRTSFSLSLQWDIGLLPSGNWFQLTSLGFPIIQPPPVLLLMAKSDLCIYLEKFTELLLPFLKLLMTNSRRIFPPHYTLGLRLPRNAWRWASESSFPEHPRWVVFCIWFLCQGRTQPFVLLSVSPPFENWGTQVPHPRGDSASFLHRRQDCFSDPTSPIFLHKEQSLWSFSRACLMQYRKPGGYLPSEGVWGLTWLPVHPPPSPTHSDAV